MIHIRFSTGVFVLLSALTMGAANAQELAPDDPSISGSLGAWFTDAANTFDTKTGTWVDSSGNDNHAVTVGEVNVTAPITYVAPTLSTISGGTFSAEDLDSVRFANDADDLLVAENLNGDVGLSELTIFVVYNIAYLAANPNLTRPVGIGSISGTQANPGDHFNLAGDPSIRKDNGQLGSGTYSLPFPAETTFIRTARMSPTAVDDWFNTDGTAQKVLSLKGVSYVTSVDDFYIGDLRAGASLVPGFGTARSAADLEIIQTLVYTSALTDEQVEGVNEWLASNPAGSGGAIAGLAFTEVILSADTLTTSLAWRSKPGKIYAVDFSTDLKMDWQEFTDEVESEGAETTFIITNPVPAESRVFYRIREI